MQRKVVLGECAEAEASDCSGEDHPGGIESPGPAYQPLPASCIDPTGRRGRSAWASLQHPRSARHRRHRLSSERDVLRRRERLGQLDRTRSDRCRVGIRCRGRHEERALPLAGSLSPLHGSLRIARGVSKPVEEYFLRAESFFNVASYMDEVGYLGGYGGPSLQRQSHGESFMAMLIDTFRGNGLHLLDEPEAVWSPSRELAALATTHELVEDPSQFVIATHSPILLSYPNASIMLFDDSGVQAVAYEDTEHFAVTRDFLNHDPRRLQQSLDDGADARE